MNMRKMDGWGTSNANRSIRHSFQFKAVAYFEIDTARTMEESGPHEIYS
jgi:hypothetical protein